MRRRKRGRSFLGTMLARRMSAVAVALVIFASFADALWAQETQRIPRVGYLGMGGGAPPPAFVQKMREAGYVDGRTAIFETRLAEGRRERLLPLAQELVANRVDVIFAFGDEAIV